MKNSKRRYRLEPYLQGVVSRAQKDWYHKEVEEAQYPVTEVYGWVKDRANAIERDLERKGIVISDAFQCDFKLKKWGMKMSASGVFISCYKGGLPLVGLLRYKGWSFQGFDGKICLYLAVPSKEQKYSPGAYHNVYFAGTGGVTGDLIRIDHQTCAYGVSFANNRMRTFDHFATALVESIGRI